MTCTGQLRDHGSPGSAPAIFAGGTKPPPRRALEQNSAIPPYNRSVSSMTWMMSFSFPTSHLNAAPAIEAATTRAAALSMSATTTLAAPARCKASQSARPMPLAPPVTTTILSRTCIVKPVCLKLGQNQIEHGRVVAGRAPPHERKHDYVLEA